MPAPFAFSTLQIHLASLLHRGQKLLRCLPQNLRRDLEGLVGSGQLDASLQFRMPLHEALDVRSLRGLADKVGHVEGEKVARRKKTLHRRGRNVVGVAEVRQLPPQRLHRRIGRRPHAAGSEPMMLCSRFDLFQTGTTSTPLFKSLHACLQLGLGLVRKPVTGAHRIFVQLQSLLHILFLFCPIQLVRIWIVAPERDGQSACAAASAGADELSKRLRCAHNPNPGLATKKIFSPSTWFHPWRSFSGS